MVGIGALGGASIYYFVADKFQSVGWVGFIPLCLCLLVGIVSFCDYKFLHKKYKTLVIEKKNVTEK